MRVSSAHVDAISVDGPFSNGGLRQRAACVPRPTAAADGMYVSLNGSLTRQMPWPDFVRLAGKAWLRWRRRQPERRQDGRRRGDARALQGERTSSRRWRICRSSSRRRTRPRFRRTQGAPGKRAVRRRDRSAADDGSVVAGEPVPKDERRKFIKERVTAIGEVLQRSKIRLGLEFLGPMYFRSNEKNPHTFMYTLPETAALAAECGPNIGVVLDAWHWHHSGGTTADILAAGKSRIVHVHVSDAKPAPPEEVRDNQRHMPGEGVIDLDRVFPGAEEDRLRGRRQPRAARPRASRDVPRRGSAAGPRDDAGDDEKGRDLGRTQGSGLRAQGSKTFEPYSNDPEPEP